MKRAAALLLGLAMLLSFTVHASASEGDEAKRQVTFFISIYNDVKQQYVLENLSVTATGVTLYRTPALLKGRGNIVDYVQGADELLELRYPVTASEQAALLAEDSQGAESIPPPKSALLRANDVERFYLKRNGVVVTGENQYKYVRDGDVIEWIYGIPPNLPENKDTNSSGEVKVYLPDEYWTEDTANILKEACAWFSLNPGTDSLFLTALSSAGKTADQKVVNQLLAGIHNAGAADETAEDLSKQVMDLSFCGYDRSNADIAQLLSLLTDYPDIAHDGMEGPLYALLAYDCRPYTVPNAVKNNRQALINSILSYRGTDGGFRFYSSGIESVDATALALTALAPYQDREDVTLTIHDGLSYLQQRQLPQGGYQQRGQPSCKSTAAVLAALVALKVDLGDKRFARNEKNLLDILLEYSNPDGGFSLNPDGESDAGATGSAILALSALKRNGTPYTIPDSLKSEDTDTVSPQVNAPDQRQESPQLIVYIIIAAVCMTAAVILIILLVRHLKKGG